MASDLASSWDALADSAPAHLAIVASGRRTTWSEFSERARRLAWHLQAEAGLEPGDRVIVAVPHRAEHLEVFYAALLLGCVPVNVDPRHGSTALNAIVDHCDAKAVVHEPARAKAMVAATKRIPKRWRPLLLATGQPYERAVAGAPSAHDWQPSRAAADDLIVLYVGGADAPTTAVAWRSEDLAMALRTPHLPNLPTARVLPLAPLTHTLGLFAALRALLAGGAVVLLELDPFDPRAVWDEVQREGVAVVSVVSDVSARALVDELTAAPSRWNLSGLRSMQTSSLLQDADRRALSAAVPACQLLEPTDSGRSVSERLRVVDEVSGRDVEPGSGGVGVLAVGGAIPVGYFKDPHKTSVHFRSIDGKRYSITGERATVDADGVIRTVASESLYVVVDDRAISVVAVETVLHKHASVARCVVVGVPDARSGERLVALVEVVAGHYLDEAELAAWCRSRLPASETPDRFFLVESLAAPTALASARAPARLRAIELLERDAR